MRSEIDIIRVDNQEIYGALPTMSSYTKSALVGRRFYVKGWADVDGAGSKLEFLWVTPDNSTQPVARWEFIGEAEFTVELFEDCVTTDDGTPVTMFNSNRASSITPNVLCYSAPTIDTDGTLIWSGKTGAGRTVTAEGDTGIGDFIADSNTKYLFRFTHVPANIHYIAYTFTWVEKNMTDIP